MSLSLPDLPFAVDAFGQHMSPETFEYHHGKHHQAYVDNGNKLIAGSEYEGKSLEDIISSSFGKDAGVFNNAAQVYNHNFFWNSLAPSGGGSSLPGKLGEMINDVFGGFEQFREAFVQGGVTQFGSGWVWLAMKDGKLEIMKTANAENPLAHGATPILTCDVWEHAYYIDYRNARPKFLEAFIDNMANWEFAEANLAAA
jgi:Fe-Mn family superoxide dismutase